MFGRLRLTWLYRSKINLGTLCQITLKMFGHLCKTVIVYREGDIVKQPMKKGSFVPKNVPGVGWGGVGWVGHEGVGWVM